MFKIKQYDLNGKLVEVYNYGWDTIERARHDVEFFKEVDRVESKEFKYEIVVE